MKDIEYVTKTYVRSALISLQKKRLFQPPKLKREGGNAEITIFLGVYRRYKIG